MTRQVKPTLNDNAREALRDRVTDLEVYDAGCGDHYHVWRGLDLYHASYGCWVEALEHPVHIELWKRAP